MEFGRNRFSMLAPIWKAKIRNITADYAKRLSEKPSSSKVTIGIKQKKKRDMRQTSALFPVKNLRKTVSF
jgi:hypothetical protein